MARLEAKQLVITRLLARGGAAHVFVLQAIDVQWTVGLATDVPVTFISVGGDFLDALLDTANFLLGEDSPPQVVSTSYGDDESAVSQKLA